MICVLPSARPAVRALTARRVSVPFPPRIRVRVLSGARRSWKALRRYPPTHPPSTHSTTHQTNYPHPYQPTYPPPTHYPELYPQVLGRSALLNAPRFFSAVFQLFRVFLTAKCALKPLKYRGFAPTAVCSAVGCVSLLKCRFCGFFGVFFFAAGCWRSWVSARGIPVSTQTSYPPTLPYAPTYAHAPPLTQPSQSAAACFRPCFFPPPSPHPTHPAPH